MKTKYFKKSIEESSMLHTLSTFTNVDKKLIENIFKEMLNIATIEMYQSKDNDNLYNSFNIVIPYIATLKIDYNDILKNGYVDINTKVDVTLHKALKEEIVNISDDKITPTEEYIKKSISKIIDSKIDN